MFVVNLMNIYPNYPEFKVYQRQGRYAGLGKRCGTRNTYIVSP